MTTLLQDLRYALRQLRRNLGFAAVAVLTLALGIGANSAIFSVVNGVLLRPLPYSEPERIVAIWEQNESGDEMHVAAPNVQDWREQSRSFEALSYHHSDEFGGPTTVLGGREATRAWATGISADFFRVLGVRPVQGRVLAEEEHESDGGPTVVVSERFWRSQLGAKPDLGDLTVTVWGEPRQIVGVMPAGFSYPGETDLWLPVEAGPGEGRNAHNWKVIGRLREGASVAVAHAELSRTTAGLKREHGADMDAVGVQIRSLRDQLVGEVRQPLLLLLGAAGFVLLVACTNLASTLLARGTARQREIAVRASLGAGRYRIVRQLLTESLLLALLGTAAGLTGAYLLLKVLPVLAPALPRVSEVGLDGRVLSFALGLAVLTAILFGLLPALRTTANGAAGVLRAGGRGGSESYRRGPWGFLVGGEVALALLLLVGSGLLIKSFWEVLSITPGFEAENVLTVDLALPENKYSGDEEIAAYYRRLVEEVGTLPGVEEVGVVNHLPLGGVAWNGSFAIEGRGEVEGHPDYRVASPGYFEALGIPLLRGRRFEDSDRAGSPHVVLVSRAMAEQYWPGEDPVGKRIGNLANEPMRYRGEGDWLTIIGVVGDVRHSSLTEEPQPALYVNVLQRPARARSVIATIRTSAPAQTLAGAVRARLRGLDSDVPMELATMDARVAESVAERRFVLLVLGIFAAVALLLAAVGIYGVVSYGVERRTREMGIRLALGATPREVLGLVLRGSIFTVAAGIAVGVVCAAALTRILQGMLYDVSPLDPSVFAAVVAVLALVALAASYLPARRATRVDPMIALRAE